MPLIRNNEHKTEIMGENSSREHYDKEAEVMRGYRELYLGEGVKREKLDTIESAEIKSMKRSMLKRKIFNSKTKIPIGINTDFNKVREG